MANLSLGFPEPQQERLIARRDGLEGAVTRFERWMEQPDSPVRAVRRIPAREAEFIDLPSDIPNPIRNALGRGET